VFINNIDSDATFTGSSFPSSFLITASFAVNGSLSIFLLSSSLAKDGISLRVIFFFFNSLFFALIPFAQYLFGKWRFLRDPSDLLYANTLILFSIILFYFGCHYGDVKARKNFRKYIARNLVDFKKKSFFVKDSGLVFTIFLVVAIFALVLLKSSFESLFIRSQSAFVEVSGGWGSVGLLSEYFLRPIPAVLLLFSIYKVRFSLQASTAKDYIILFICLCFTVLLNFPTGTARFYAFTIYLSLIISVFSPNAKRGYYYLAILLIGTMGSSVIDGFRYATSFTATNLNFDFDLDVFFVGHYDAYEMFVHSIDYVETNGPTMGRQLLGTILFWVPRSIWINKPVSTAVYLSEEYLDYNYNIYNFNVSSPYIEEFYIDFHVFGVVIGSFLMGVFFSYLDRTYKLNRNLTHVPLEENRSRLTPKPLYSVLYPMLIGLSLFFLRGAAMTAFAYVCGVVSAYVLVSRLLVKSVRILP
jgi:oligosaccharide repeat unit polymerase